jgi:hypothetical protein
MAKTKYDKYISQEVVKELKDRPGSYITSTRHLEKWGGGHLSVDMMIITRPHQMISQPHKHEFPQYLHFFSVNPADGRDFDAEIEVTLGDDTEHGVKYVLTSPAAIYVPAGLYHGPLNFKTINKPVLFIDVAATAKYSRVGNTPD